MNVALKKSLLAELDEMCDACGYGTRAEFIRGAIREKMEREGRREAFSKPPKSRGGCSYSIPSSALEMNDSDKSK